MHNLKTNGEKKVTVYKGEDEQSSIAFYKEQIVTKMAEVLAVYIEMKENHPEHNEPMHLEWCSKYLIVLTQKV